MLNYLVVKVYFDTYNNTFFAIYFSFIKPIVSNIVIFCSFSMFQGIVGDARKIKYGFIEDREGLFIINNVYVKFVGY